MLKGQKHKKRNKSTSISTSSKGNYKIDAHWSEENSQNILYIHFEYEPRKSRFSQNVSDGQTEFWNNKVALLIKKVPKNERKNINIKAKINICRASNQAKGEGQSRWYHKRFF